MDVWMGMYECIICMYKFTEWVGNMGNLRELKATFSSLLSG